MEVVFFTLANNQYLGEHSWVITTVENVSRTVITCLKAVETQWIRTVVF